jgi:hypothetical protein
MWRVIGHSLSIFWHTNTLRMQLWRYALYLLTTIGLLHFGANSLKEVAASVADLVVDGLYTNVHRPPDEELPPSAKSFVYGPLVASVIGGKGEGLNCSIPEFLSPVFRLDDGDADVSLQFRQACVSHDFCYRHGHATYGYSQAECDHMLQEASARICNYIASKRDMRLNCERRSKKVLLGVRLGGSKAFMDTNGSTYFEYESAPLRSGLFLPERSLLVRDADGALSEQIAHFTVRPSTVSIRFGLGDAMTLPVEPSGLQAAPIILPSLQVDGANGPTLIGFLRRMDVSNTVATFSHIDPGAIAGKNSVFASPQLLRFYRQDFLASSPVVLTHRLTDRNAGASVVALTPQLDGPVRIQALDTELNCWTKERNPDKFNRPELWRASMIPKQAERQTDVDKDRIAQLSVYRYRFFQHAPLVGPFSLPERRQADALVITHGRSSSQGNMAGTAYRDEADILTMDMTERGELKDCDFEAGSQFFTRLPISEDIQPVSRLVTADRVDGNGTHSGLIGARKRSLAGMVDRVALYEAWLDEHKPAVRGVPVLGGEVDGSWLDRPPLVMKPKSDQANDDAVMVMSRAQITASDPDNVTETVRVQLLTLNRKEKPRAESEPRDAFWQIGRTADCLVTYRNARKRPENSRCGFTQHRTPADFSAAAMAPPVYSIGNQLKGAQMLAGNFLSPGRLSLALADRCFRRSDADMRGEPESPDILFHAEGEGEAEVGFAASRSSDTTTRAVFCKPLNRSCVASPINSDRC